MVTLVMFMREHPDLTHLCLDIRGMAIENEDIQKHIEKAFRKHNGLTDLEVHVRHPLSENAIAFFWRLYFVVRRNRVAARLEAVELHDTKACPPFIKVQEPSPCSDVNGEAEVIWIGHLYGIHDQRLE
jgi:hypothetical protein